MSPFHFASPLASTFWGVLVASCAQAQTTILPDSNAVWHTHYWDNWMLDQSFHYYLSVEKEDTFINDTAYVKLYGYGSTSNWPGVYCGGLFDNGMGKLFFHHAISNSTYTLENYDVLPGDSVPGVWAGSAFNNWPITQTVYVVAVDTVSIGGLSRKAIGIVGFPPEIAGYDPVHWWIQGIGGTGGLLETSGTEALDVSGGLECMSHGDTILWQYGPAGYPGNCLSVGIEDQRTEELPWFHPTIANETLTIDLPLSNADKIEILSLDGRLMSSQPLASRRVPVSHLVQGCYLLRFVHDNWNTRTARFMKQ